MDILKSQTTMALFERGRLSKHFLNSKVRFIKYGLTYTDCKIPDEMCKPVPRQWEQNYHATAPQYGTLGVSGYNN